MFGTAPQQSSPHRPVAGAGVGLVAEDAERLAVPGGDDRAGTRPQVSCRRRTGDPAGRPARLNRRLVPLAAPCRRQCAPRPRPFRMLRRNWRSASRRTGARRGGARSTQPRLSCRRSRLSRTARRAVPASTPSRRGRRLARRRRLRRTTPSPAVPRRRRSGRASHQCRGCSASATIRAWRPEHRPGGRSGTCRAVLVVLTGAGISTDQGSPTRGPNGVDATPPPRRPEHLLLPPGPEAPPPRGGRADGRCSANRTWAPCDCRTATTRSFTPSSPRTSTGCTGGRHGPDKVIEVHGTAHWPVLGVRRPAADIRDAGPNAPARTTRLRSAAGSRPRSASDRGSSEVIDQRLRVSKPRSDARRWFDVERLPRRLRADREGKRSS